MSDHIFGAAVHVWWAATAYVIAVQIHNGLVHIGNALMNLAKVKAAEIKAKVGE